MKSPERIAHETLGAMTTCELEILEFSKKLNAAYPSQVVACCLQMVGLKMQCISTKITESAVQDVIDVAINKKPTEARRT